MEADALGNTRMSQQWTLLRQLFAHNFHSLLSLYFKFPICVRVLLVIFDGLSKISSSAFFLAALLIIFRLIQLFYIIFLCCIANYMSQRGIRSSAITAESVPPYFMFPLMYYYHYRNYKFISTCSHRYKCRKKIRNKQKLLIIVLLAGQIFILVHFVA